MTALNKLEDYPGSNPGWVLSVSGKETVGGWKAVSPYGTVHSAVVPKDDGTFGFARPAYRQARYCQTIVWGRAKDGKVRLALIAQARPHSDAPGFKNFDQPNEPIMFLTSPMGFLNQVQGKIETAIAAAMREMSEEVGESVVLSKWQHPYGLNASPSFETTFGDICAIEVDISSVIPADHDPEEPIAGHFWLTVKEWMAVVAKGTFTMPDGQIAYPCFGASNGAILAFLCTHPLIMAEAL